MGGNLFFTNVAAIVGNAYTFVFPELRIGIAPPVRVIDTAPAAVVAFCGKGRNRDLIDLKSDIRRPVVVVPRGFGTDLERKFNL